ncbi:MAG: T9SS type A sorting domain-containing protein [Bacteroidota bacterium]
MKPHSFTFPLFTFIYFLVGINPVCAQIREYTTPFSLQINQDEPLGRKQSEMPSFSLSGIASQSVEGFRLDSTYTYIGEEGAWKLISRYVGVSFDVNGNTLEALEEFRESNTGMWVLKDTISISYFPSGQRAELLKRPWLSQLEAWGDTIVYQKYKADGFWEKFISLNWLYEIDEPGFGTRITVASDSLSSFRTSLSESFSGNRINWRPNGRSHEQYNSDGRLVERISETWSDVTASWDTVQREIFTYVENGRISSVSSDDWEPISQSWLPNRQWFYTYDTSGPVIEQLGQKWKQDSSAYVNEMFHMTRFDSLGTGSTTTIQSWNSLMLNWDNSFQVRETLDGQGLQREIQFFDWNPGAEDWRPLSQQLITTNIVGNLLQAQFNTWDSEQEAWVPSERTNYFYTSLVGGVTSRRGDLTAQIQLYPNPTSSKLTLDGPGLSSFVSIELYDPTGKLIMNLTLSQDFTLEIPNLPAGIYLLGIETGKGKVFKRVMVE